MLELVQPLSSLPFDIVGPDDRLLVQLLKVRDKLVDQAESLSIQLETQMNPGPAASLEGDEQAKARHLFLSQAKKIETQLNKLTVLVNNFRVHIY